MSKKKAGGKTIQHKRPNPKHLGVKVAHGEKVGTGQVLVRQRGSEFKEGKGVKRGRDFTLYSTVSGSVKFGKLKGDRIVSIQEE